MSLRAVFSRGRGVRGRKGTREERHHSCHVRIAPMLKIAPPVFQTVAQAPSSRMHLADDACNVCVCHHQGACVAARGSSSLRSLQRSRQINTQREIANTQNTWHDRKTDVVRSARQHKSWVDLSLPPSNPRGKAPHTTRKRQKTLIPQSQNPSSHRPSQNPTQYLECSLSLLQLQLLFFQLLDLLLIWPIC